MRKRPKVKIFTMTVATDNRLASAFDEAASYTAGKINRFLKSVRVVRVSQSSAALPDHRIVTFISIWYWRKKKKGKK